MITAPNSGTLSTTEKPRLTRSPDGLPWAAETDCLNLPLIQGIVSKLLDLRIELSANQIPDAHDLLADAYWPSVARGLLDLRADCELLLAESDVCKPWVRVVVRRLQSELTSCIHSYRLECDQAAGNWPPYPLHSVRRANLDRIFHALAYLPAIAQWRPVEAAKCRGDLGALDNLITKTAAKVFDAFRDDIDWLTWGTAESLQQDCEELLERRRDDGGFHSGMPSRIKTMRLLADRLGCEEPALAFEDMDELEAFIQTCNSSAGTWSVEVDNGVRDWLRRIVSWCGTLKTDSPDAGTTSVSKRRKTNWTKESANLKAIHLMSEDPSFIFGTVREWNKRIGCSEGLILKLPLWEGVQKLKKSQPDDRSVRTMATSPRFLADVIGDDKLKELAEEGAEDFEQDQEAVNLFERSWRSRAHERDD